MEVVIIVFAQILAISVHAYLLSLEKKYCGHCDWWWDTGAVIFFVLLLIGANEGLILSEIIAGSIFTSRKQGRGELKGFLLRFVIIFTVCFAIAALQAFGLSKFGKSLLF